jgi:2-hydroxymuconate-semialdehyde hydrolase
VRALIAGLDQHTPRLEWGVIDSLSVVTLLAFTKERFGIEVPQSEVAPENLNDLASYVSLLDRVKPQAA